MGRKRIELSPALEAEIELRTRRGESAETVHRAVHGAISKATIIRRQSEIRAGTKTAPPGAPESPPDETDVPETIPENATVDMLDRWIKRVEAAATKAEQQGNLAALSSLAMRVASLAEAKRKATPLPKPDPNENPDMKALAAWGEKELLKRVHALFAPGSSAG